MKMVITIELDEKDLEMLKEIEEEELEGSTFKKEKPKKGHDWEYWYCDEKEAVLVLRYMKTLADKYGHVSLADYKDMLYGLGFINEDQLSYKYTDNNYGWTAKTLIGVKIHHSYKYGHKLNLPHPTKLN